jgi:DNA repair exonuclease SbcCD nuclease subunit
LNNVLIFSDLHITQSSLKECTLILEEIGMLANKYNVDTLIDLGDTFDSLKPTSSELDVFATFIRRLNKKIIILAANSHESETEERSILNHYGILSNNVQIVKEFKDGNHLYCGHFSIKESLVNYGAKLSKEDLKNYLYVFLGHIHSYQLIKPNIVHLGSSRYVSFDEAKDKQKIVALISDYGTETEKVHFMKLKSPISMIELQLSKKDQNNTILDPQNETSNPKESISEGESASNSRQNQAITDLTIKLDQLDPKTKVKVKILDFASFREFLPFVNKYSNKFSLFKYETSFEVVSINNQICKDTETKTFKESFQNWLSMQLNLNLKIKEILQKEIE